MDWATVFNEQILPIILTALGTFLTGFCAYLGTKLKNYTEQKLQSEEAERLINATVQYVEQVFKDLHGTEKLNKAIEQATVLLQSKGIEITPTEIYVLIEAAVQGLNQGLYKDMFEPTEEKQEVLPEDTHMEAPEVKEEETVSAVVEITDDENDEEN